VLWPKKDIIKRISVADGPLSQWCWYMQTSIGLERSVLAKINRMHLRHGTSSHQLICTVMASLNSINKVCGIQTWLEHKVNS
jgi:hypothetical protein